ncbi:MAG: hypothetical protein AABX07_05155 [Nanoarchaeota archaeon]
MANDNQEMLNRIKNIEIVVEYIKDSMPSKDMFLSTEEKILLQESYAEEKSDALVSSKEARKKLGI